MYAVLGGIPLIYENLCSYSMFDLKDGKTLEKFLVFNFVMKYLMPPGLSKNHVEMILQN